MDRLAITLLNISWNLNLLTPPFFLGNLSNHERNEKLEMGSVPFIHQLE